VDRLSPAENAFFQLNFLGLDRKKFAGSIVLPTLGHRE